MVGYQCWSKSSLSVHGISFIFVVQWLIYDHLKVFGHFFSISENLSRCFIQLVFVAVQTDLSQTWSNQLSILLLINVKMSKNPDLPFTC